jgi:hypothetical protein
MMPGPAILTPDPGNHEDAGPDDLGQADDHQVQAGEAAAQALGGLSRKGARGPRSLPGQPGP